MTRATHWLRRSKHVGFPRHQIAMTVAWERVPRDDTRRVCSDVLTGWEALEWSGPPGSEVFEASGSGPDADSWWRWLSGRMRRKTCTWVWGMGMAHALTLLGFWGKITDGTASLSQDDARSPLERVEGQQRRPGGLCVVGDPPTIVLARLSGQSGSLRMLDVRNLGVESWAQMGGGRRDAHSLASWLQSWIRTVDHLKLGGLRQTAAAQAWHGWRHSYLEGGVLVHGSSEVSRLERASVHPGRAEAYRLGLVGGPVHQLDASAHYPACAVAGPLPVRLRWAGACNLRDVRAAVSRGWLAICECQVQCARPLLPCRVDARGRPCGSAGAGGDTASRSTRADRTVWPVGRWSIVLPWPEVSAALDRGVDLRIVRCALYEGGRPVDGFVSALWGARERFAAEGRAAERSATKLILNSLVGKWAAHGRAWSEAPEALPPADWTTWYAPYGPGGKLHTHRAIGWHVQREDIAEETPESVPALAAWTYSVGRVRLLGWMETAGEENVYYVDSDGLFTSASGQCRLAESGSIRPGVLGALRVQGVHETVRIGGIRDYTAGSRTVQAGTPLAGVERYDGLAVWYRPETVAEACHTGTPPESVSREVVVPVHRAYRHGVVSADGRVSPLRVEE